MDCTIVGFASRAIGCRIFPFVQTYKGLIVMFWIVIYFTGLVLCLGACFAFVNIDDDMLGGLVGLSFFWPVVVGLGLPVFLSYLFFKWLRDV